MKKIKAAFFDRDGTLIEDANYLNDLKDIKFIPKIFDLCILLQNKGYKLFVITNQSGIARGFFGHDFMSTDYSRMPGNRWHTDSIDYLRELSVTGSVNYPCSSFLLVIIQKGLERIQFFVTLQLVAVFSDKSRCAGNIVFLP